MFQVLKLRLHTFIRVSVQIRATTELPLAKVSRIGSYVNSVSFSCARKQKYPCRDLNPAPVASDSLAHSG